MCMCMHMCMCVAYAVADEEKKRLIGLFWFFTAVKLQGTSFHGVCFASWMQRVTSRVQTSFLLEV